jgi:hypothetical protein
MLVGPRNDVVAIALAHAGALRALHSGAMSVLVIGLPAGVPAVLLIIRA